MEANMSKPLRLGVLGPGGIVRRVMKDFNRVEGIKLVAVGSRDLARAQKAAAEYGAELAFGSYEELAACPDVDLIYVATPHNYHMEHSIMCMNRGKHVLCEKPMALNDGEVLRMIDCARANGVFLMEAMWTRLFPACYKLRELIRGGVIGEVRHVSSDFAFNNDPVDPESRLFSKALAGGALLDVGIYTLAATSMVLGWEPEQVLSACVIGETGVDVLEQITLKYGSGAMAHLLNGLNTQSAQCERICGTEGYIEVPNFWHPTLIIVVDKFGERTEYSFDDEAEGFRHEFAHVRDMIAAGKLESDVMPLEETLALSRISTELRREWGLQYPGE